DGTIVIATPDDLRRYAVISRFSSTGQLIRQDKAPAQSAFQAPLDVARLADGRLAFVGSAVSNYFGEGRSVVTLNDAGEFGPIVKLDDESNDNLFSGSSSTQLVVSNGDLVVAGASASTAYSQSLIKIDAGSATEKPDHIPAGSTNDLAVDSKG